MGEREKQYTGTISYKKLFELMEQRKIKKRDLREKYNISLVMTGLPSEVSELQNDNVLTFLLRSGRLTLTPVDAF